MATIKPANRRQRRVSARGTAMFLPLLCVLGILPKALADPIAGTETQAGRDVVRNIVLIVADDLGIVDLACYGNEYHETPNLDRLADDGLKFTQAYAAAPVCSPTRASIMTGKTPARLHMTVWHEAAKEPARHRQGKLTPPPAVANLPLEEFTLAEALKAAGYFTIHIGKWHLGEAAFYPENHGFDINIGGTFWGAPSTFFFPFRGPFGRAREPRYVPVPEAAGGVPGDYLTDKLTDEAIRALDKAGDRPFFLNLWFHTVHTPIEGKPDRVRHFEERRPAEGARHRNPEYAAMVSSLDENVGRLLRHLDDRGLARNTLVIFTSDNGGYINRYRDVPVTSNLPFRSGKGSLYEGGIRVPLIMRLPGVIPVRTTTDQHTSSQDLYPTILEFAGVQPPPTAAGQADGMSLAEVAQDPTLTQDRSLFWHYPHYYPTTTPISAVREGPWKFLRYYEDNREELYRLTIDPGEKHDLVESHPDQAEIMRQLLNDWIRNTQARLPSPSPAGIGK